MLQQMKLNALGVLACLAVVAGIGCSGGGEGRAKTYPVSGKVTFSGGPLIDAVVTFAPRSGQPTAFGRTDENGEYELSTYGSHDGAAEGDYAVVITKVIVEDSGEEGGDDAEHSADPSAEVAGGEHSSGEAQASKSIVPQEYTQSDTTPLKASVTASGENTFDFEL